MNTLKTFVIEKSIYKKLRTAAEKINGDCSNNMTDLYMKYMCENYLK